MVSTAALHLAPTCLHLKTRSLFMPPIINQKSAISKMAASEIIEKWPLRENPRFLNYGPIFSKLGTYPVIHLGLSSDLKLITLPKNIQDSLYNIDFS